MSGWVLACMMLDVYMLQIYEPKQLEPCRIIKSLQSRNLSDSRLRDFLRDHGLEITAWPLAAIVISGLISFAILNLLVLPTIMLRFGRFTKREL
jgi:hypothetical protein